MSMRRGNLVLARAALLMVVALAACISSPRRTIPPRPPEPPPTRPERQPAEIVGTHRYEIAGHKGFIEDQMAGDLGWSLVYDDDWNLLGSYTDRGRTFRHRGNADPEFIGEYDPDSSLRALHGIQSLDVPVRRSPIGSVLTLEDVEEEKRKAAEADGTRNP